MIVNDDLMNEIDKLDEEVREKSYSLLTMRNRWLYSKGWKITSEIIGPTRTYFYNKFDELFICEQEAIDRELHGK